MIRGKKKHKGYTNVYTKIFSKDVFFVKFEKKPNIKWIYLKYKVNVGMLFAYIKSSKKNIGN